LRLPHSKEITLRQRTLPTLTFACRIFLYAGMEEVAGKTQGGHSVLGTCAYYGLRFSACAASESRSEAAPLRGRPRRRAHAETDVGDDKIRGVVFKPLRDNGEHEIAEPTACKERPMPTRYGTQHSIVHDSAHLLYDATPLLGRACETAPPGSPLVI